MAWEDLNLHHKIADALRSIHSFSDVLTKTNNDLINQTGLNHDDVIEVKRQISKAIIRHSPIRVLQLCQNSEKTVEKKLSVGSKRLDEFLHGGILVNRVTEISGESASGKSQLCLQISLTAQLPEEKGGLNAAVAYVCTEVAFPSKRFHQMAEIFSKKHPDVKKNFTDNVFIEHISYVDTLKKCLSEQIPLLINQKQIGLIIIDSITAVFRGEYEKDFLQRSKDLRFIGTHLHRLCTDYGITVVCVNQVSGTMEGDSVPSLGVTWANLINVRLFLSRLTSLAFSDSSEHSLIVKRTLEVTFAPNLPKAACRFIIDKEGIV